jgi:ubiquinone/menaquinone biosynthesis C-methylase UbiE
VLSRVGDWNRNIHYHAVVLRAIPENCELALEVGCGQGLLARKLVMQCREVVAIDVDHNALEKARVMTPSESRVVFVAGDVMTQPFAGNSFDLITAVATLHHLPLRPALERCRDLLKPGGVIAIIGLYRLRNVSDYAWALAALPVGWTLKCLRGYSDVGAPIQEPAHTLIEIKTACYAILPGCVFKRRLLFRYSLIWRKP